MKEINEASSLTLSVKCYITVKKRFKGNLKHTSLTSKNKSDSAVFVLPRSHWSNIWATSQSGCMSLPIAATLSIQLCWMAFLQTRENSDLDKNHPESQKPRFPFTFPTQNRNVVGTGTFQRPAVNVGALFDMYMILFLALRYAAWSTRHLLLHGAAF